MSEGPQILEFRPASAFPITKRSKARCNCSSLDYNIPKSVWIDEHTRMVECRTCGAQIEPFDYLWVLATEHDKFDWELKRIQEELTALNAQRKNLEEELKVLRTDKRKLGKQQEIV